MIEDYDTYINRTGVRTSVPGIEEKVGHSNAPREFHLYVGKGCENNCCYCGGCKQTQLELFGRRKPVFRQLSDVAFDINQLEKNGIETVYIDFDPQPSRTYYKKLFDKIEKQNLNLIFSAWSGPINSNLLSKLGKTFNSVEIVISPETSSERLRKELLTKGCGKQPFYTNKQLLKFLAELKEHGFKAMVYFISGLPWETEKDFQETLAIGKEISEKYREIFIRPYDPIINRNLCAPPLYLEPGSPIHRNPEKFGMILTRKTFRDFVENTKNPSGTPLLGTYCKEFNSENSIVNNAKKFKATVEGRLK